MQAFSPQCRTHLSHYGCHIAEEIHRSNASKQQHTDKSRTNHFIKWTKKIALNQDPCLPTHNIQARNYLVACFAVSLIRGETIQGTKVRHATLRKYAKAVVLMHKDRDLPSPYGAPVDYITIVLNAVKKFEKQKNRRDMIHDEMIHHMEKIHPQFNEDSLNAALIDWIYLGRFVGYRGIEWSQTTQQEYLKIEHPNWEGPASYVSLQMTFNSSTSSSNQLQTILSLCLLMMLNLSLCASASKRTI